MRPFRALGLLILLLLPASLAAPSNVAYAARDETCALENAAVYDCSLAVDGIVAAACPASGNCAIGAVGTLTVRDLPTLREITTTMTLDVGLVYTVASGCSTVAYGEASCEFDTTTSAYLAPGACADIDLVSRYVTGTGGAYERARIARGYEACRDADGTVTISPA